MTEESPHESSQSPLAEVVDDAPYVATVASLPGLPPMGPGRRPLSGREILDLAAHRREWVSRRIDQINLPDDRTIYRNCELHLGLDSSEHCPASVDEVTKSILLPIFTLKRSVHMAMTIRDAQDAILPRISRNAERRLIAEGIIDLPPGVQDEVLLDAVLSLINTEVQPIGNGGDRYAPLEPEIKRVTERLYERHGKSEYELRRAQEEIYEYVNYHLLLAAVPSEVLERPLVLQVIYSQALPTKQALRDGQKKRAAVAGRLVAGTLSTGILSKVSGVGSAQSFHISVSAPPGFRVHDMFLEVIDSFQDGTTDRMVVLNNDRRPSGGHVYVNTNKRAVRSSGTLRVAFYSNKTGFLMESLIIALVTSALLAIFSIRFEVSSFDFSADEPMVSDNFAAGLVLLFPAIAISIATQRESHRLASRVYALQKLSVLVIAIAAAAAALPIALRFGPKIGERWWYASCLICWIVSLRVSAASLLHFWRISQSRDRALRMSGQFKEFVGGRGGGHDGADGDVEEVVR